MQFIFFAVAEYGLFSQDDDPSKGKWLEPARALNFYPLKSGVSSKLCKLTDIICKTFIRTNNNMKENCIAHFIK